MTIKELIDALSDCNDADEVFVLRGDFAVPIVKIVLCEDGDVILYGNKDSDCKEVLWDEEE